MGSTWDFSRLCELIGNKTNSREYFSYIYEHVFAHDSASYFLTHTPPFAHNTIWGFWFQGIKQTGRVFCCHRDMLRQQACRGKSLLMAQSSALFLWLMCMASTQVYANNNIIFISGTTGVHPMHQNSFFSFLIEGWRSKHCPQQRPVLQGYHINALICHNRHTRDSSFQHVV